MRNHFASHPSSARRKRVNEMVSADPIAAAAVPVVGIGASAGGIEALGSFFDAMPANSGCASNPENWSRRLRRHAHDLPTNLLMTVGRPCFPPGIRRKTKSGFLKN